MKCQPMPLPNSQPPLPTVCAPQPPCFPFYNLLPTDRIYIGAMMALVPNRPPDRPTAR